MIKPVVTIEGPFFKDEGSYLTNEGYPLGTTCYYYVVYAFGMTHYICADTEDEAWNKAITHVLLRGNRNRIEWLKQKLDDASKMLDKQQD